MCLEDRPAATVVWLNQQLDALWKVSDDCLSKHGRNTKPSSPEMALSTSLAQLCVGGNRFNSSILDTAFYCEFAAPDIDFICNHDVLLVLKITSGQFSYNKDLVEHFEGHTCAFRVPFRQHFITDTTYSCYGQPDVCKATFIILDLNAAEFVPDSSYYVSEGDEVHGRNTQRTIVKYLRTEYFPLLQRAGCHFIHSLPEFNRHHRIDWSMTRNVTVESLHVFNIGVELINSFLNGRWLEHGKLVDDLDDRHDHSTFGEYALAEHRGICEGFGFHAFFGPPEVTALCSKEALFTINIHDLAIYRGDDFTAEPIYIFKNWKIVVVTEIHAIQSEGGVLQRLKLEFSQARLCEGLSSFPFDLDFDFGLFISLTFVQLRMIFTRYIMHRYLLILEEHEHSHIYRIDVSVVEEGAYVEEDTLIDLNFEFLHEEYRERVLITETFKYDMITVVTQACINNYFRRLWKASLLGGFGGCISHWAFDKFFDATFGPIQIRLPHGSSSKKVTVFLTLESCEFALLDCFRKYTGEMTEKFTKWRIAFEVDLIHREYTKKHLISDEYMRTCPSSGQFVNHQLVLDFKHAEFSEKLSHLPGLFDETQIRTSRRRRSALLRYITKHYLTALRNEGHHVLFTFPIWKANSRYSDFSPISFSHRFYGPSFGDVVAGNHRLHGNRNMIVICGMINSFNRPRLPRCPWSWSSSQDAFHGAVVLSRTVFLSWLLKKLADVNFRTTFKPNFKSFGSSEEWRLVLETLEGDETGICDWRLEPKSADSRRIVYEHHNTKSWSHDHFDDSRLQRGGYNISCETTNRLILPTVSNSNGCDIVVSGTVKLDMSFDGEHQSWSSSSTAKWSYTISIVNCGAGYGLDVHRGKYDYFKVDEDSGYMDTEFEKLIDNAPTLLRKKLEGKPLIDNETIRYLKELFCGVWPMFYSSAHGYTLRNPRFNEKGDFILELESPWKYAGELIDDTRRDVWLPGYESRSVEYKPGPTHELPAYPAQTEDAPGFPDESLRTKKPFFDGVNGSGKDYLANGHSTSTDSADDEEHLANGLNDADVTPEPRDSPFD